jgi:hypothetical protein
MDTSGLHINAAVNSGGAVVPWTRQPLEFGPPRFFLGFDTPLR